MIGFSQTADDYYNEAMDYSNNGEYQLSIDNFTKALRIDPDYFFTYRDRGIVKETLGMPYCSDYKRACELGDEDCCEWYYTKCK